MKGRRAGKRFWIQMVISAVVAFSATAFGVQWSFSKQLARAEDEKKAQFGRILQGVLAESANNQAILNNIKNTAKVGSTLVLEMRIEALQIALGSPLFYDKADYSLVLAAHAVRTRLATINNILSHYRQAAAGGRGITKRGVSELRIRAETSNEVIAVMQNLLDETMPRFAPGIAADPQSEEVGKRIAAIFRKERQALDRLGK